MKLILTFDMHDTPDYADATIGDVRDAAHHLVDSLGDSLGQKIKDAFSPLRDYDRKYILENERGIIGEISSKAE